MKSDRRLKVAYVGVAFGTYYADEHNQYGRAIGGLPWIHRWVVG